MTTVCLSIGSLKYTEELVDSLFALSVNKSSLA